VLNVFDASWVASASMLIFFPTQSLSPDLQPIPIPNPIVPREHPTRALSPSSFVLNVFDTSWVAVSMFFFPTQCLSLDLRDLRPIPIPNPIVALAQESAPINFVSRMPVFHPNVNPTRALCLD
jgi:hypothetical protein